MTYTANSIKNYIVPPLSVNVTSYQSPGQQIPHTHSHDNPASDTVSIPDPAAFESDLAYIEQLITDLKAESVSAESNRPSMKLKKD